MNTDAIILGAGIIGAACAEALGRAGLSVKIIDRDFPGSGTTSAGMGHIVVMDDSDEQFEITSKSVDLWAQFAAESPEDIEYEKRGTVWVASDEEEFELAKKKHTYYQDRNVRSEIIDSKGLLELEPNLREGLAGGLLVEDDAVVYQLSATKRFLSKCPCLELVNGEVESIQGNEIRLVDGSRHSADTIINALGVGSAKFSPEVVLEPKKGHLLVTERLPNFAHHQTLELGYLKSAHASDQESVAFNVQPRATGQVLIGSSRQPGSAKKGVERRMVSKMLARAIEFMPALKNVKTIRSWVGFRPSTPDNLPIIGRSTTNENIVIASGHEGLGITTSTVTGQLVSDLITGGQPLIDPAPFSPARFSE